MPPTRGLLLRWLTDKNSWFRSLIIGSPGLTFSIELLYISWASVRCSAFVPAEVTRNTSTAASPNVVRHPIGHTLKFQAESMTTNSNASAIAKEVQANTQGDAIAPHLLLRRRTMTELNNISRLFL